MNLLRDEVLAVIDLSRLYPVRSQDNANLGLMPATYLLPYLEVMAMEASGRNKREIKSFRFLCSREEADAAVAFHAELKAAELRTEQECAEGDSICVASMASRTIRKEPLKTENGFQFCWAHIKGVRLNAWKSIRYGVTA